MDINNTRHEGSIPFTRSPLNGQKVGNKLENIRSLARKSRRENLYPADWKSIVAQVRERSGGRCECMGECGLHRTNPGPRRCVELGQQKAIWAGGIVMLTTAHRDYPGGPCDCEEKTGLRCGRLDHLAHLCNRCHLRWDVEKHQRNARETRRRKALTIQPEFFEQAVAHRRDSL